MADFGTIQQVVYGDLQASYNGLPFTLTHWKTSRSSARNADGIQMGRDVRIECSGYIESSDAEGLASAYAAASATLGADGGDFRVQLPKDDGEGGLDWHPVEQVLSSDTHDGIHVEALDVIPAGGHRLDIALVLSAQVQLSEGELPPDLPSGATSSSITYEWTSGDEQRSTWKASGELRSEQGQDAQLIVQACLLPVIEAAMPFGDAQAALRSTSEESATLCRWDYTATELAGGYPDDVTGGEREISTTADEQFGVITVDRGRYVGDGAQAFVDGLLAQAADAVTMDKSFSSHQLKAASWTIVRRGAVPGRGDCCVEFHETIRHQWSQGACIVKEYLGADPIIISPQVQPVLRFVQEGRAVGRDPNVFIRAPEKHIPGHEASPRQIDVERVNRRQLATTWRYETVSVGIPSIPFVRPSTRDEEARGLQATGLRIVGPMTS